jgi:hypothetical protein
LVQRDKAENEFREDPGEDNKGFRLVVREFESIIRSCSYF